MSELYHHGIKGMSWGKRNGPPYPLEGSGKASFLRQKKNKKRQEADYSTMSDDEKKQAKEKAIREGNIREANANRNEYSDQELQAVKNRFELNQRVSQLSASTVKTGQQRANDIASKFETAARLTNAIANTATAGIRTYNALGMITARINGTKFTPIGQQVQNKQNKKEGSK